MDDNAPGPFPMPGTQDPNTKKAKSNTFKIIDINVKGILITMGVIAGCLIAWVVIRDLSGLGSGFGFSVVNWVSEASIDPDNQRGFASFLRLLLIAGGVGFLLSIWNKTRRDKS